MTTTTISLEQHTKEVAALRDEVGYLKEQLEWFKKQLFGQKADKFVDSQNVQQLCFEGFNKLAPVAPEKRSFLLMSVGKESPQAKTKLHFLQICPLNAMFWIFRKSSKYALKPVNH